MNLNKSPKGKQGYGLKGEHIKISRRLERAIERIKKPNISKRNKSLILEFRDQCYSEGTQYL